jgi:hypothetical protein
MREVIEILVEVICFSKTHLLGSTAKCRLQGVLRLLRSQGNLQDTLTSIPDMNEYKVLIFDPTISLYNGDGYHEQRPSNEVPGSQKAVQQSYQNFGIHRQGTQSDQSQTDCGSIESRLSSSIAPGSVSPYFEEPFFLNATASNPKLFNEDCRWAPSEVYLPVRYSSQHEFDIMVKSSDSLVDNIKSMFIEVKLSGAILTFL